MSKSRAAIFATRVAMLAGSATLVGHDWND
jgi:hypothetical protein